jgi:hypothetical protein
LNPRTLLRGGADAGLSFSVPFAVRSLFDVRFTPPGAGSAAYRFSRGRLFGTFRMPANEFPKVYGVDDQAFPSEIAGQLAYPFRK